MPVDDPTAYGLVRLHDDHRSRSSSRSRSADQIDTKLISAGAYVLERAVLDLIPPDRNVSIEREVWPQLVGDGLFGYAAEAYWLDIGTPERYLQGTFDILEGNVTTAVADRLGSGYLAVGDRVQSAGRIVPPALVERGCEIAAGAHVGSLVVLGEGVDRGGGHDDRALGRPATAPRSARTACCATASSPPACASARARRSRAAPCSARA